MGFTVDENYDDDTLLADYYSIIKSNVRRAVDILNVQRSETDVMDGSVTNIQSIALPQISCNIEKNKSDIRSLAQCADAIIENVSDSNCERLLFRKNIPDVKYCVFQGDMPLTENASMETSAVADAGVFEQKDTVVKFYADDDCELAGYTLDVMVISGVKVAFLKCYQSIMAYQNKWIDAQEGELTWDEASKNTWEEMKTHKI